MASLSSKSPLTQFIYPLALSPIYLTSPPHGLLRSLEPSLLSSQFSESLPMGSSPASRNPTPAPSFHDFLPAMAEKLGGDGLISELCKGFSLLVDGDKGVITFDSLKRNSALLGLHGLGDDDLRSMLREGDFDGDGALNQMEFCVLMFRLSPELMEDAESFLEDALEQELKAFR